jgi:hypothetical protein
MGAKIDCAEGLLKTYDYSDGLPKTESFKFPKNLKIK